MEKLLRLSLVVLLCACYGSGDEDENSACERADRSGTYHVDFENLNGSCGVLADESIRLDGSEPPAECRELEPPQWSPDDCTLRTHTYCALDESVGEDMTIVSTQQDSSGTTITGTIQIGRDTDGVLGCLATYEFTATKQ